MGMFDYVKCDYPLPVSEEFSELSSPPNWPEIEFQTKSLFNSLEVYTIEEDGQIYKEEVERDFVSNEKGVLTLDETVKGIIKVEYTGEIDFYHLHAEGDYDYWIEFRALVWKGELKELWLKEFHKESNLRRKEVEAQVEELLKQSEKEKKREQKLSRKVLVYLVRNLMFLIRWPISKIVTLTWKIERWLL